MSSHGYQSIPQDELEANYQGHSVVSSIRVEEERRNELSTTDSLFSKQYKFSAGFLLVVSCIVLMTLGVLSMNMHSMASPATMESSGPKKHDTSSSTPFGLIPCMKHCEDSCGKYSPSKHEEYCCNWSKGEKGSHTCSLTVTDHGECFCSASYLDYSFLSEHKKDKKHDNDDKDEKVEAGSNKQKKSKDMTEVPTMSPSNSPVPPPWSNFIPDPWNPFHNLPTFAPTETPAVVVNTSK